MRRLCSLLCLIGCSSAPSNPPGDAGTNLDADVPDASMADSGPQSRLALSLAINHGASPRVVRGWPMIARASAALEGDLAESYPLSDDTLSIHILDAAGAAQAWPLHAIGPLDPGRSLSLSQDTAEVPFTLSSTDTRALALGTYRAKLRWGDANWTVPLEVVDPPAVFSPSDRVARASLEHEFHVLHQDLAAAQRVVSGALALEPSSVTLLERQALTQEAMGDDDAALESVGHAYDEFSAQYGDSSEPPVLILRTQSRVLERILGGAR